MSVVNEELKEGVLTITLNRPDKKNSMNSELLKGLSAALANAREKEVPVIFLRGSGGAFCAGGDIMEFWESEDAGARIDVMAGVLHDAIKQIRYIDAVVISVLDGVAVGAGLSLAAACDLVVATPKTVLNMGYRRIGLTTDGGGSFFLPRLIGVQRFNECYLFSRNIEVGKAKEWGLINFVFDTEELEEGLKGIAKDLLALPTETIGDYKKLVNNSMFAGFETHLEKEQLFISGLGGQQLFKKRLEEFFRKKG